MTTGSQRSPRPTDSRPWYRQFWPWFLIALPGSVVVAAFTTLYIANRHADDLVVSEYYRDGLAINRQLEKQQAAQALGYQASVRIIGDQLQVSTRGIENYGELRMQLSHPLEADRDFDVRPRRIAPNLYATTLANPVAAHWHWILDDGQASAWRLDGSLAESDVTRGAAN